MTRRILAAALSGLVLAGCASGAGGAFAPGSPTPGGSSGASASNLDIAALIALRSKLVAALGTGIATPAADAGPYPDAAADALVRVAGLQSAGAVRLDGLDGGPLAVAYLALERTLGPPPAAAPTCPAPAGSPVSAGDECASREATDRLMSRWYALDTKAYFHVGDTSTDYRPVDALAVGCALVVAGFREEATAKIDAGEAIVTRQLQDDLDPRYGFLYGRMTVSAGGPRTPTDTNTRLADQAAAAEFLLQAFERSREQQYQAGAAKLLTPFLHEPVTLRANGYLSGFDTQGLGPATGPVDVEATLLVLQAAHHYDVTDGNHYGQLEEVSAQALLDATHGFDPSRGLPAVVNNGSPGPPSRVVTALGAVVLGDVTAGPSPSP